MRVLLILSLVGLISVTSAAAQDTLTFDNGNVLTGRIKRLAQGELTLDIPIADGDVYADWRRVVRVDSRRVFQFQTSDGDRFLGRIELETDPEAGTIVVEYGGVTQTYQRDDIVLVVETVGELTGLLQIGVSAGLTLAKSNDQKQVNAESNISYETTRHSISATTSSIFTQQRDAEDTNRQSATILFSRWLGQRWGLTVLNSYLKNNEQSLDLRTVVGGGPSRTFVQNGNVELFSLAGIVWNNEQYSEESDLETNDDLEALIGVTFSYFQFKQWELDSSYLVYPSLTSGGRLRQSITAKLRLRLIKGKPFWWSVSQTLDLDNEPPEGTPGTDYVTTTSLSWTFP